MTTNEDIAKFTNRMNELKNQYAVSNTKSMFFKNTQKFQCAESIQHEVGINELLNRCIFIIPGTNCVYMDYPTLKLFANPAIFHVTANHILALFMVCIQQYKTFNVHLNLQSFTISAADRYKDLIHTFCQECFQYNTMFSTDLQKMHIYHTPQMIDNIARLFSPWIEPNVRTKFVFHEKGDESAQLIKQLLTIPKTT